VKPSSLFLIAIIALSTTVITAEKIKLYAIYTPSHEILKNNYFLPSIQDDFELIIEECEQTCPSATFLSTGWTDTTIKKIDLILRAIEENWGNIFIFSDVDIQFFGPIEKIITHLMKNNDLVIQKNSPDGVLCTGFFACRANEKTRALWQDVKKIMEHDKTYSDQKTLNKCIKRHSKKNPYNITWDYLPVTFFGGGTLTGYRGYIWTPGKKLPIPTDIIMHHANWTRGIKNKIAQLEYVKQHVEKQKSAHKERFIPLAINYSATAAA